MTPDIASSPSHSEPRACLWLRVHSEPATGTLRRRVEVSDAAGQPLATALVPRRGRTILVESTAPSMGPRVTITIRRLFPLTGRVDIADSGSGARLGGTSRLGVVRRADGAVVGRFRDARSMRGFVGEGVLTMIVGLFTGGGDADGGTSASTLRWVVDGQTRGELGRASWPFGAEPPPLPRAQRGWIARFIPERVARALRSLGEHPAWKLELEAQSPSDERLTLAAAIFAVELSRW